MCRITHLRWTATKDPPRPFARPTSVYWAVRVQSMHTRVHLWPSSSFKSAESQGKLISPPAIVSVCELLHDVFGKHSAALKLCPVPHQL